MAICDIIPQIKDSGGNYVDSKLFADLVKKYNSREEAISIYRQVHSDEFLDRYGDWINNPLDLESKLDENKEPLINTIDDFTSVEIDYLAKVKEETSDVEEVKFKNLVVLKKQQIRDVHSKITSLKSKIKSASLERKQSLLTAIEVLNTKLDTLNTELENLGTKDDVEYIYSLAEQELKEAEAFIEQGEMPADQIKYVDRIINTWTAIGDVYDPDHMFLDEADLEEKGIVDTLVSYGTRAKKLGLQVTEIKKQFLVDWVEGTLGREFNEEDLLGDLIDVSTIKKFVRDVSKVDHPIFQAIFKNVKTASINAKTNSTQVWENIDDVMDKALPILKKLNPKDPFKPFKQVLKDGSLTGNITYVFTQDFFDEVKRLRYNAFRKPNSTQKDRDNYNNFKKNHLIYFDPRILIPDSDVDGGEVSSEFIYASGENLESTVNEKTYMDDKIQKLVSELKDQLGETLYNKFYEEFEATIEDFKDRRAVKYKMIFTGEGTDIEKKQEFTDWLKINSPYYYLHSKEQPSVLSKLVDGKREYYKGVQGYKYAKEVPKRIVDKKDSGWYDTNYDTIVNNPVLKELHDLTISILKEIKSVLPEGKQSGLQINTLPTIEKSIIDMFSEKGSKIGIVPFMDKLRDMIRASDTSEIVYEDIDPLTSQVDKQMQVSMLPTNQKEINDYTTIKESEALAINPKLSEQDLVGVRAEARREIVDKIAKRKSFDLGMVLKSYYLLGQSFKHKSYIEDQVSVAADMFNTIEAQQTNNLGKQQEHVNGKLLTDKKALNNMREMLEYYLDSQLYSLPTKKIEGKTKLRVLTSEEKIREKELISTIEKLENTLETNKKLSKEQKLTIVNKIDSLNKQKNELGGYFAGSEFGDLLLKYNQLKTMGWNILSAVANVGFGFISNFIEGSDGRLYNNGDLRDAYLMVTSSIGKSLGISSPLATKITALMYRFDVLSDQTYETFEKSVQSSFTKKLKKFGPYEPTKRTEYLNQAPLMIAVMKTDKITSKTGVESSLWEAFNEQGKLKEEFRTEENLKNWESENSKGKNKFQLKLDTLIHRNHGNYDPDAPMMKNKLWITRALSQFRTWMYEGFATRFETYRYDDMLGVGVKGRYRTGVGFVSYAEGTNMSPVQQTLFNLKQLGRKLILWKKGTQGQYEEAGFNEIDAANMRKNLTEMVLYMSLYSLGLMLKAAGSDDEDQNLALNFLINQGNRLETDILMYTNPMELETIINSSIPLMSLIGDGGKWLQAAARQFDPDARTVDSGPLEGMNWLLRRSLENIPYSRQGIRVVKNLKQLNDY